MNRRDFIRKTTTLVGAAGERWLYGQWKENPKNSLGVKTSPHML